MSDQGAVLVVDDAYLLAIGLEDALTRAGFRTGIAFSGEEALSLFTGRKTPYRALITDVRLCGGMSGWELAKRIRETEPDFPIVYASAATGEQWASEGVPNSIFIPKPFVMARLISAVVDLLGTTSQEPASTPAPPRPCGATCLTTA